MESTYTLWERFKSKVPVFWRKIQMVGGALTVLGGALAAAPAIPPTIITILLSAGPTLAFIGQFAVISSSKDDPNTETTIKTQS